ncbi:hypothetical protein [Pseudomonas sp. TH31]|uniref:hypothetical protein n=1 Tax=Pseudomonas sp. TH31 TaxID=2796396 RepID=UPI00191265F4|nr:hypothetical protein [Pseudomonas sp. TH31]MBK5418538.1 hypothetical protein [Pseudomonas sp. TH31]
MPTLNAFLDRYRSTRSSVTESNPMVIDTEANPKDILETALKWTRAGSNLLETLYCHCFKDGDVQDIPHITHALCMLMQDGCVARQRMLGRKAPV